MDESYSEDGLIIITKKRVLRNRQTMHAPYDNFRSAIWSYWGRIASNTIRYLNTGGLQRGNAYNVNANITGVGSQLIIASGSYSSTSGIHAEIAAIKFLGANRISRDMNLTVDLTPCKRCAAILSYFISNYNWTVYAPINVVKNYLGSYELPEFLLDMIIGDLIENRIMKESDANHHRQEIKSDFCGASW